MSATAKKISKQHQIESESEWKEQGSSSWKSKREILERMIYQNNRDQDAWPNKCYLIGESPCKDALHEFCTCMTEVLNNKDKISSESDKAKICDAPFTAFEKYINHHPKSKQYLFDDHVPPPASWDPDRCCIL